MSPAFHEGSQLPGEGSLCSAMFTPKVLSNVGDFLKVFLFQLSRIFPLSGSFLMVFSKGSKGHRSVEADSKIYNVFVLADCQLNRPFPAVLYADLENQ